MFPTQNVMPSTIFVVSWANFALKIQIRAIFENATKFRFAM